MKLKKKSGLIGLISVLAGVSVVSVGFAAWVVSAGDTKTIEGEITVEEVSDQRHALSALTFASEADKKITYGVPSNPASVNDAVVLNYTASEQREHLSFTFTFTVDHFSDSNNNRIADLTINFVATQGDGSAIYYNANADEGKKIQTTAGEGYTAKYGYEAANLLGLVGTMPSFKLSELTPVNNVYTGTNIVVTKTGENDDHVASFSATVTFEWGEHFVGNWLNRNGTPNNPYVFYNPEGMSTDQINAAAADAVTALGQLHNHLSGVEYTMTVQTLHA